MSINFSSSNPEVHESVAEQTRTRQKSYIKAKNGDAIGNNWVVPKGNFAHFMEAPGQPSAAGQPLAQRLGDNAHQDVDQEAASILRSLHQALQEIGEGAAKNGNAYRNMFVASGRFANQPGREKDMFKDDMDAIAQGSEKGSMESQPPVLGAAGGMAYLDQLQKVQKQSHHDNMRLLEVQYKMQDLSKTESLISNLIKKRSDVISQIIRESGRG